MADTLSNPADEAAKEQIAIAVDYLGNPVEVEGWSAQKRRVFTGLFRRKPVGNYHIPHTFFGRHRKTA
jgi:phosphoribosylformimino-5-aminoimidazole carboxamide ribonucleotide (ProFAR) isomerase